MGCSNDCSAVLQIAMVYYWFVDPETGAEANLQQVKDEFLSNLSGPTDEMQFELLTLIGIYCTMSGPFDIGRFLSVAAATDLPESHVYLYFLRGKYHFGAGH